MSVSNDIPLTQFEPHDAYVEILGSASILDRLESIVVVPLMQSSCTL